MNLTRSVLWTVIGFVLCSALLADSPNSTPTRLALGQSVCDRVSFGDLIRGRLADVQLVSDQSSAEEKDSSGDAGSGEEASDPAASIQEDDENEDRQRHESMMSRIAALKKPASEIMIRATASGTTPTDRSGQLSQDQTMIVISAIGVLPVGPNRYTTCFTHRPLYYEQRNLERCGRGHGCCQNGVSGAQFLWNTMLLPCKLRQQHCDSQVPAGGDCAAHCPTGSVCSTGVGRFGKRMVPSTSTPSIAETSRGRRIVSSR